MRTWLERRMTAMTMKQSGRWVEMFAVLQTLWNLVTPGYLFGCSMLPPSAEYLNNLYLPSTTHCASCVWLQNCDYNAFPAEHIISKTANGE